MGRGRAQRHAKPRVITQAPWRRAGTNGAAQRWRPPPWQRPFWQAAARQDDCRREEDREVASVGSFEKLGVGGSNGLVNRLKRPPVAGSRSVALADNRSGRTHV